MDFPLFYKSQAGPMAGDGVFFFVSVPACPFICPATPSLL